jgi:predicted RNA-binding Zn-ribbon protein involved in translation (DUF1610 family)
MIHKSITLTRVMEAVIADDYQGFCLSCGADAYSVEPDASNYTCETCGEDAVAGTENVLLMIA